MKGGPLKGFLHTHVKYHEFVCANNQQFLLLAGGTNLQSSRRNLHLLTHDSQVRLRSLPKETIWIVWWNFHKVFLYKHVKYHEFVCTNNQLFLLLAGGTNLLGLKHVETTLKGPNDECRIV